MTSSSAFLQFWWTDRTRNNFLSHLAVEDLASIRLACHDFGARAAPELFKTLPITFRPSTFTKPARMAALGRIGHHVRTVTFSMPHGPETFLPPLLDCVTGEEVTFVYEPYCQPSRNSASRLSVPTYGSWEMTDLLVKQYPPLFHAAANVSAFIRAFSALPNLVHLKVSTPGQEPAHRYRRSTVDYALISLRIAIERAPLSRLSSFSLLEVHPAATLYLTPTMGFGARPNSQKRWKQIRKLDIQMDCIPASPAPSPVSTSQLKDLPPTPPPSLRFTPAPLHTDHLKLLHTYLHTFAPSLTHFSFRWLNPPAQTPIPPPKGPEDYFSTNHTHIITPPQTPPPNAQKHASARNTPPPQPQETTPPSSPRGPFPISLSSEPILLLPSPPLSCPRRCHLALRPLKFTHLTHMSVENTSLDASQVAAFITAHRRSISEFAFEKSDLRTGTWDEALNPLTRMTGSEAWKHGGEKKRNVRDVESMDVPLLLSPLSPGPVGRDRLGMSPAMMDVPLVLEDAEDVEEGGSEERRIRSPKACPAGGWGKVSKTGRGLLFGTEEHMKRFLGRAVFTWL